VVRSSERVAQRYEVVAVEGDHQPICQKGRQVAQDAHLKGGHRLWQQIDLETLAYEQDEHGSGMGKLTPIITFCTTGGTMQTRIHLILIVIIVALATACTPTSTPMPSPATALTATATLGLPPATPAALAIPTSLPWATPTAAPTATLTPAPMPTRQPGAGLSLKEALVLALPVVRKSQADAVLSSARAAAEKGLPLDGRPRNWTLYFGSPTKPAIWYVCPVGDGPVSCQEEKAFGENPELNIGGTAIFLDSPEVVEKLMRDQGLDKWLKAQANRFLSTMTLYFDSTTLQPQWWLQAMPTGLDLDKELIPFDVKLTPQGVWYLRIDGQVRMENGKAR
jgi:hypothetical protein